MSDELAQCIEESNRLGGIYNDYIQKIRDNYKNPKEIESVRAWIEEARHVAESRYNSRLQSLAVASGEDSNVVLEGNGEYVTHSIVEENFNSNLSLLEKFSQAVDGLAERKAARARIYPQIQESVRKFKELVENIKAHLSDPSRASDIREWIAECKRLDLEWKDLSIAYIRQRGILKFKELNN